MKGKRWIGITAMLLGAYLVGGGILGTLRAENVQPRVCQNLNREWKYAKGDFQGAERPSFDDREWENVGLPHSFSIPYFMSRDFYVGYGWYRRSLTLTRQDLSKRIFLEFDGVFQEAEVFVNGRLLQTHVGGYTGFNVDITASVREGENKIAVRVNNLWRPDVAPRAGEHVFSGGIYRNVRLMLKSPAHIDWYGTFVTTPGLAESEGQTSAVNVCTDVCNATGQAGTYRLLTQVVDAEGAVMASVENKVLVPANGAKQVRQETEPLNNPKLWSPETPVLYKVVSRLYRGDKLQDVTETAFGFRWFEWTAENGFFLNGTHRYLRGANVHQDHAGWGDAVTESGMRRDVLMMKEAGFDFIRGSHYPHAPAFSRACDEEGMLFWSEAPFWGIGGFKPDGYWDASAYPVCEEDRAAFEASALQQLEEMIRIHRNHPSVIAWSMCNEAFFSAPESMDGVRSLLRRMVERTHELDPTRPASIGGAQRPLGEGRIDRLGDIAGYNGDGATQPDFQQPGVPCLVSEYGSTTADRPGNYAPGWGDLQKNDAWKGCPWRSGQAIWCGFDHGSIAGSQLGKMGIVDYFRIPKRSWYWYRQAYRQVPPPQWAEKGTPARLRIDASKTEAVLADGTEDVQLTITVTDREGKELSNAPKVTLTVVSGPGEFPTGRTITFEEGTDIRILDGKAAIEFRSYFAGTSVIEATSPGLPSARIHIRFTGAPEFREGVSPVAASRPYVRFVREIRSETDDIQTFGRNNPTFASSSAPSCPAGYAADGDLSTCWQAKTGDHQPWLTLDTEKGLSLREVQIRFPSARAYRYKVEASEDNVRWERVLADRTDNRIPLDTEKITVQGDGKHRFVRISFMDASAGLPAVSEIVVKGKVL